MVTDGDDNSTATDAEILPLPLYLHGTNRRPSFEYALGTSHQEKDLRAITRTTHGLHFDITNSDAHEDWDEALNSMLMVAQIIYSLALGIELIDLLPLHGFLAVTGAWSAPSGSSAIMKYDGH